MVEFPDYFVIQEPLLNEAKQLLIINVCKV